MLVRRRSTPRRLRPWAPLVALIFIGSCDRVAPTSPEPLRLAPVGPARFAAGDPGDSPSGASVTLSADSKTGGAAAVPIGEYPMGTLVDISASGQVILTWTAASGFSGQAGYLDPGGRRQGYYHDICTGYGEIALIQNNQTVAWHACALLAQGFSGRMLLQGSVTATRSVDSYVQLYNPPQHACGYPSLGWPGDCVTYSGTQTVTATRVQAELTLAASSGGNPLADGSTIAQGTSVTFTAGRDPDLGGAMPWAILRWRFDAAPDPGGTPPDPSVEPRTKPCATISSVCTMTVYESGTVTLEGMPNGQKQAKTFTVTVAKTDAKLSLDGEPKEGPRGVQVVFTPKASDGSAPDVKGWDWASDSPKAGDQTKACDGAPATCVVKVFESGHMTVHAVVGGVLQHASAPVKILPLTVEIASIAMPLPDESFTTRLEERSIRLTAKVSDPSREADVQWKVVDDPADQSNSGKLATPPQGVATTLIVTPPQPSSADGPSRWTQLTAHPGALDAKQLAYIVRAYVVTAGDTTWSKPRGIKQHEKDVLRQEYVDYQVVPVPHRDSLQTDFHTEHFTTADLNSGDYAYFPAKQGMRDGIEAFRTEMETRLANPRIPFTGLYVNGGYRDPLHHHTHTPARSRNSQHLHGNAIDFNIDLYHRPAEWVFEEMKDAAHARTVAGCYEPENVVRAMNTDHSLNHFHIDFRGACPVGW